MKNAINFMKSLTVGLLFLSSPVLAADIPATMLLKEKTECKQECTLNGNNEITCETLCNCTVDQFSKLDLAQFQSMKSTLDAEIVPPELQSYLAGVGAMCVAELDRVVDGLLKPSF